MSVKDYVNRTADLLLFHGDFPNKGEQRTTITLFQPGTGGLLCTGAQKLAQRLLTILLTKQGSVQHLPDYGTTFMIDGERGTWRTVNDVSLSFYTAARDLKRQLRAAQLSTDPLDEIVDTILLTNVTLNLDQVSIRILMTTEAGTSYVFVAPISVAIK